MPDPESSRRLAVVLSHPTQYYSPWFRWIRAHTGLGLRVFYLWDFGVVEQRDPKFNASFKWDVDLLSGYDYEFVPNASEDPGPNHFTGFNNPLLLERLSAWGPTDLLMFGYKSASHLRVILWCLCRRVPLFFRGDSHLMGRGAPRPHARLALHALYSQISAFLYVGVANREYFEALGVPDSKLFFAPHSVNEELFNRDDPAHKAAAAALRGTLGAGPATRIILFAGKLVPEKQPMELLEAFLAVSPPDSLLVFVGDGQEKDALKERASRGGQSPVRFLPFANQTEMPARYLLADVFVLPSRGLYETWGLAINEAMHMGVPCIASKRVGCQRDLVTPGETGWVFDPDDPAGLSRSLSQALADLASPNRAEAIRRAVGAKIAGYTYAQTTAGLLAALAAQRA